MAISNTIVDDKIKDCDDTVLIYEAVDGTQNGVGVVSKNGDTATNDVYNPIEESFAEFRNQLTNAPAGKTLSDKTLKPEMSTFLYVIDKMVNLIRKIGGSFQYSDKIHYNNGGDSSVGDLKYCSLQDDNHDHNPTTSPTYWRFYQYKTLQNRYTSLSATISTENSQNYLQISPANDFVNIPFRSEEIYNGCVLKVKIPSAVLANSKIKISDLEFDLVRKDGKLFSGYETESNDYVELSYDASYGNNGAFIATNVPKKWYAVGEVCTCVGNVNPNNLYNGTWQEIPDTKIGTYELTAYGTPQEADKIKNGWLHVDGRQLSRSTYSALYNALLQQNSYVYNTATAKNDILVDQSGDASTTFRLPQFGDQDVLQINTAYGVNRAVSAGLPNIAGQFGNIYTYNNQVVTNGCFSKTESGSNVAISGGGTNTTKLLYSFDASASDSVYGAADTVRVKGYVCQAFIYSGVGEYVEHKWVRVS